MTTTGGDGVTMVPYPMVEGESAQDQVIADQEQRGLRYKLLDLGTLEYVQPTPEMKGFLRENM